MPEKQQVIAIEEHYLDTVLGAKTPVPDPMRKSLMDLGPDRISLMDRAGVDIQVLSHMPPGGQALPAAQAVEQVPAANDRLADAVKQFPDRLAAFATLPTRDPAASADELARCVNELGFKGCMLHGLTENTFHDDKRFWPIYKRAVELDVPVYLHPGMPHGDVAAAYYGDFVETYPMLRQAALGFTAEMMTSGIRMAISGVFDAHPDLTFILGHLGEGIPFLMERIDESLSRNTDGVRQFRNAFTSHFHITTSGFFSDPALNCSLAEMGADRILFAIDYPFVDNDPGTDWFNNYQINPDDRAKIANGNARKLLKM